METTHTEAMQDRQNVQVDPSLQATTRRFTEAFNRADANEVSSFWAEDGTLISPAGLVGKGRAGVARVFRNDLETVLPGTTSNFTITSVRRVPADVSFIDLDHDIQNFRMPDGTARPMTLHLVVLARRRDDTWQWLDARPYAYLPEAKSLH